MSFQLITDGGADLPKDFSEKHNIVVVPLNIDFDGESYQTDELTIDDYYSKFEAAQDMPKTAAPSPNAFYDAYKKVDPETPILTISLTKALSATYQNAVIAKEMLLEEEPDRSIEVINSTTASSGLTLLLDEAIQKREEGSNFKDLVNYLRTCADNVTTLFSLATVENLVKGGRLDRVRGRIVKTLNIKLLMKASEIGDIEVTEKVRGEKKALRRLVEQISDYAHTLEDKTLALAHSNCEDKAKKVLAQIREIYQPKKEILVDMGPLIANYAGEGGLVISFLKDAKSN